MSERAWIEIFVVYSVAVSALAFALLLRMGSRAVAIEAKLDKLRAAAPDMCVDDRNTDVIMEAIQGTRYTLASNHDEIDGELRRHIRLVDGNRQRLESIDSRLEKMQDAENAKRQDVS